MKQQQQQQQQHTVILSLSLILLLHSKVAAAWVLPSTSTSLVWQSKATARSRPSAAPAFPSQGGISFHHVNYKHHYYATSQNDDSSNSSQDNDDDDNNSTPPVSESQREANRLLERAKQARQEAERLEKDLVNSKLKTLEGLLERQSQLSKADEKDIQNRIDQLKNYRNPPPPPLPGIAMSKEEEDEEDRQEGRLTEEDVERMLQEGATAAEIKADYVKELQPEDKEALEQVQSIFLEFKDILNTTIGQDSIHDDGSIDPEEDDFLSAVFELESDLDSSLAGNITEEDLEALKDVKNLASDVWKWSGLDDSDWENVKQKFTESMVDAKSELDRDPVYFERLEALEEVFPIQAIESSSRLEEADMVDFVKQVMLPINNDVFSLNNRNATRVGSVYLLQGTPKLDHGDEIVQRIEKQLVETGLQDKYRCYYIQDPTRIVDAIEDSGVTSEMAEDGIEVDVNEIFEFLEGHRPAVLVSSANTDLSPVTRPIVRALLSCVAVFSISFFAESCYDQDVVGISSPIFLGIIGIQVIHELGHFVAAALNKIEIAFPFTMFPSLATGLMHTSTEIKSPPKNNDAMFDFAMSGPLLGMMASWSTLLYGLQLTASVRSNQVASLPHMPLEFFQLSTLTSATIESFLGTDVLLSLDPISDNVAVHPLVIAGHVGILINALDLLATSSKTTDGNRMLSACVAPNTFLDGILQEVGKLFLLIQGIRVWGTSSYMLLYLFLVPLIQHPTDVTCRNNVDPAGGVRPAFLAATTLLAVVAVSPSF